MPRELQPCGTPGAYQRHMRRGETPCAPCATAWKAYSSRYKSENAAAVKAQRQRHDTEGPRRLAPCGTRAAYARHLYNREKPCFDCRVASSQYHAERRAARKAVAR